MGARRAPQRCRWWAVPVLLLAALGLAGCDPQSLPAAPAASNAPSPAPPGVAARVTRVIDGDTFVATPVTPGAAVTVRVLGIDTPETKKPGVPVQCGGPEATAYAQRVLGGQAVTLVPDPTQDARDRYGRTLAYPVLSSGANYSVQATDAGIARAYTYDPHRPVQLAAAIADAQTRAQGARRGLWGPPCNDSPTATSTTTSSAAPTSSSRAAPDTDLADRPYINSPSPGGGTSSGGAGARAAAAVAR